jgi:hypothetical protein
VLWQYSESGNLSFDKGKGGTGKEKGWGKEGAEEKEGETIKMRWYVTWGATTEVSYWKGIESIVFHQLIFSESLFIGADLDSECGRTIEMGVRKYVAELPFPPCGRPS